VPRPRPERFQARDLKAAARFCFHQLQQSRQVLTPNLMPSLPDRRGRRMGGIGVMASTFSSAAATLMSWHRASRRRWRDRSADQLKRFWIL